MGQHTKKAGKYSMRVMVEVIESKNPCSVLTEAHEISRIFMDDDMHVHLCDMFGRDIVSARAVKDSEYYAVLQGLNIAGAADLSFMGVFFLVDEEAEEGDEGEEAEEGGFFVDGDDEA